MYHYKLSDEQVLKMPARRFWLLNKNLNRLMAENDIRNLQVLVSAESSEGTKQTQERLFLEIGPVVVQEPTFDRDGLNRLKQLSMGV